MLNVAINGSYYFVLILSKIEDKETNKTFDLKAGAYELFIISQSGQSDEVRFRVE